jgi:PhoPQ-activated pathogenicity-related protein
MDGTVRHSDLLAKLGKHSTTGYCVYIRQLSDVQLPVLEQIIRESYGFIESQDKPIRQILWRAEV